ncbi:MAG TPA: hypothetical protein VD886_21140 [Herpetosiphonaceae bacterium]|nr:hypothetical protein [Herpetosiphonaceae bacterium]
MTEFSVEVRSRTTATLPGAAPAEPIYIPASAELISVTELIGRAVAEQIRSLLLRHNHRPAAVQATLGEYYGLPAEPGAPADEGINLTAETRKARAAFKAGAYAIFLNGRALRALDEQIELSASDRVIFLRMTPLAGG